MGLKFLDAVYNGLRGVEITGPWGDDGKTATLDAYAFAMLVTIAYRQPDPGAHGDDDPICIIDRQTLMDTIHASLSTVIRARKFLIESGLITYAKHERHRDIGGKRSSVLYSNVYRVNLAAISAYAQNQAESGLDDGLGEGKVSNRHFEVSNRHPDNNNNNTKNNNNSGCCCGDELEDCAGCSARQDFVTAWTSWT